MFDDGMVYGKDRFMDDGKGEMGRMVSAINVMKILGLAYRVVGVNREEGVKGGGNVPPVSSL